jgi:rare lipoprotein A
MRATGIFCGFARSFAVLIRFSFSADRPVPLILAGLAGGAALNLGGCAELPAERIASAHPKEYFPSSVWGPASPRVVADGEPVPRGGGMYMVGKPYTIGGRTYYPSERRYVAKGLASWYGGAFHGRRTANGEIYDLDAISAAHPTMPLPSYARVTNLRNHYSMIVRVNDRGPFADDRIMDVSRKTAEVLEFSRRGTTPVKVEYVAAADLAGSDDLTLLATLRSDGPAPFASAGARDWKAPRGNGPSVMAYAETQPIDLAAEDIEREPASIPRPGRSSAGVAPLPPPRPLDLRTAGHGKGSIALR